MSFDTQDTAGKHSVDRRGRWTRIGLLLAVGLFVAYLDRANLSIGITGAARDLGFSGASFPQTSSLVLTAFFWGYLVSNLLGGFLTARMDAKWIIVITAAGYSLSTVLIGFTANPGQLLTLRIAIGVFEGFYWPQQFRLIKEWFVEREMSRANALIEYYGQYASLAIGFLILTPVYAALDWRALFWILGGIGLVVILPLFMTFLRSRPGAPQFGRAILPARDVPRHESLTFRALGGWPFILIVFSYFTNGLLFWGITLFLPQTVAEFKLSPITGGLVSAIPYLVSIALAVPMISISDKSGRRGAIAVSGLVIGGILVACLPLTSNPFAKFTLISLGLGYFTATYNPNIWAIAVIRLNPNAVGPATGIMNGIGAGAGGIVAGPVMGSLLAATGAYFAGFAVFGLVAILGGIALIIYLRVAGSADPSAEVSDNGSSGISIDPAR